MIRLAISLSEVDDAIMAKKEEEEETEASEEMRDLVHDRSLGKNELLLLCRKADPVVNISKVKQWGTNHKLRRHENTMAKHQLYVRAIKKTRANDF